MLSSCKRTALTLLLKKYYKISSIQVIDSLLQCKTTLPKYLVEKVYQEDRFKYPDGTVEFLVAQGYSQYGSLLNLGLESESNDSIDDYSLFLSSFNQKSINITHLTDIYNNNGFSLVAVISNTHPLNDFHWNNLYKLLQINPQLAFNYLSTASFNSQEPRIEILRILFRNLDERTESQNLLEYLMSQGFAFDALVINESIIREKTSVITNFAHAIELLTSTLNVNVIKNGLLLVLQNCFTDTSSESLNLAEMVCDLDEISIFDVKNCFYADSISSNQDSTELLFMTRHGQMNKSMTDCLWQYMLVKYGINHEFTMACFNDLLLGGVSLNEKSHTDISVSHSLKTLQEKSVEIFAHLIHTKPNNSLAKEAMAIESMDAMFTSGQPFKPSLFGIVSNTLLKLRTASKRFVYWMSHVEQWLISNADRMNESSGYKEWNEAFKEYLIEDPQWKLYSWSPPTSGLFHRIKYQFVNSDQSMQRFYECVYKLYLLLESIQSDQINIRKSIFNNQSATDSNSILDVTPSKTSANPQDGPFCKWFSEL